MAAALGAVVLLAPGCGMSLRAGSGWSRDKDPDQTQRQEPAPEVQHESPSTHAAKEAEAERQKEVLNAVEQFLTRTEDFENKQPEAAPALTEGNKTATAQPENDAPRMIPATVIATRSPDPIPAQPAQQTSNDHQGNALADSTVANTRITVADRSRGSAKTQQAVPVVKTVAISTTPSMSIAKPTVPVVENRTTNQPMVADVADEEAILDRVFTDLRKSAGKNGGVAEFWRLMLAGLAFERQVDVDRSATSIPTDARQLIGAVSEVVEESRRLSRNPMLLGNDALKSVRNLNQIVAEKADPEVPIVRLCREVITFGVYEELDSALLVAGEPLHAIVYTEVTNFRSERQNDQKFRTILATHLELMTKNGETVWQREEPEIVDHCRQRRRDFFIAQRIQLPATIAPGDYVLKVLVEDKLSGRANEGVLDLTLAQTQPVVLRN
jgi:hypothetical protein